MRCMVKSQFSGAAKKLFKALGIAVGIVLLLLFMTPFTSSTLMVDEAMAAGPATQQGSGKMMGGGQGGKGGKGDQTAGSRSGAKGMKDAVLADEGDDDSDRPPWAGGNPTENPHSGGGEGKPDSAGTMKGDDFGDLIVLVRDPDSGEPILDEETGELQVCLDVNCNDFVSMVDGEVPDGVTPVEVDFGRAAVARSPSKVTEKALTDAISKLTAENVILSTDTAGRISYSVDGGVTWSTIDSPLENLALYIDLVTGLADDDVISQAEAALGDLATLQTAASLFAGVADKTGDISIDYVVYQNVITDVVDSGDYYLYDGFTYTREFPTDYTYFYMDGDDVKSATLNINDYLAAINGDLPTGSTALFAAAADDAVEVIELIHTQIHDAIIVLP